VERVVVVVEELEVEELEVEEVEVEVEVRELIEKTAVCPGWMSREEVGCVPLPLERLRTCLRVSTLTCLTTLSIHATNVSTNNRKL